MAQLDEVFDPSTIEDTSRDFSPLPVNVDFLVQITDDELKPTKAGTGEMINFSFEIVDGQYAGRKFWERVNWKNQSAQAQTIGRELLKKFTEAILGVGATISDTSVLHYKPFIVTLKATEAKGNYGPGTAIAKVRSASSGAAPAKPVTNAPAPRPAPAAAAATGGRPWPTRAA